MRHAGLGRLSAPSAAGGLCYISAMKRGLIPGSLAALLLMAGCGGEPEFPPGTPPEIVLPGLAEGGDAEAQVSLGWMYQTGQGFAQDYHEAAHWYRRAAEQGNALAQYSLAELYARGLGLGQDYEAAALWHRRAAERGNLSAQIRLAYLYENGLGVPRDYSAAVYWYARASQGAQGARGAAAPPPSIERMLSTGISPPVLIQPPRETLALEQPAVLTPLEPPAPEEAAAPTQVEPPLPEGGVDGSSARAAAVWVHVASFRTTAAAALHWQTLKERHGDLLGGLTGDLARVDLGEDKGVWVRLRAGPLADAAAARALCLDLRARDVYCAPTTEE